MLPACHGNVTTKVLNALVFTLGTLNINTGHGPRGEFREPLTRVALEANLTRVVELLRDEAPDVVCLQEVDFRWRGSCRLNQAEWIANRAGYAHVHQYAHHKSPLPRALQWRFEPTTSFSRAIAAQPS